jgi:hypothetical protein
VKKQAQSLATLLELGADPNIDDAAGLTPLDQAALAGEQEMVQHLLGTGAEIRLPSAILLDRPADVDRLTLADPDLYWNNRMWARLLVRASSRSPGHVIETLLRAAQRHRAGLTIVNMEDDPDTAIDNANGYTPLHAAAFHGNNEAVTVLLRHGANPRRRDSKYCDTPAGWARYAGHPSTRNGGCSTWAPTGRVHGSFSKLRSRSGISSLPSGSSARAPIRMPHRRATSGFRRRRYTRKRSGEGLPKWPICCCAAEQRRRRRSSPTGRSSFQHASAWTRTRSRCYSRNILISLNCPTRCLRPRSRIAPTSWRCCSIWACRLTSATPTASGRCIARRPTMRSPRRKF